MDETETHPADGSAPNARDARPGEDEKAAVEAAGELKDQIAALRRRVQEAQETLRELKGARSKA